VRSGELVATDESTVTAEPFLDSVVVEDSQSDGRFPDPACTDESNRRVVFSVADDPLDQLVASETRLRRWGRQFSRRGAVRTSDYRTHGIRDC